MRSKWRLERYTPSRKTIWDEFVRGSRNGTFLFMRDYMDYHADRFHDCSLMAYYDNRLSALLPAHAQDCVFCSHKGLTYGGVIADHVMKSRMMLELFNEIMDFLRDNGFEKFVYSPIPYIYKKYPGEEDLYALYRVGAQLTARKISTVVCSREERMAFSESKRRNVKRAVKERLVLCKDDDFEAFWKVLEANLEEKHHASPVHSLDEIKRLHTCFPDRIVLHRVCDTEGNTLAGCVMYLTDRVAHAQYISSTEEGRTKRAVDFLFHCLINEVYKDKMYFDLGTSVECGGRVLNEGLIYQKEGFGGRAVVYDTYELVL